MSGTSRRNFIKAKLLGGLFLASGIPLFSLGNLSHKKRKSPPLKTLNDEVDWNAVREQFQIKEGNYFFNTASLGSSPQAVIDRICESLQFNESIPREGYQDRNGVRKKVAEFLNAKPSEIGITRNATEGMNIVARSLNLKAGDEVVLTNHEHIGGSAPWLALQKDVGITIKLVDLDLEGENNFQRIKHSISAKTKVISFSHVTCTTGMRLPAKEIIAFCRANGIYSCVDGAQVIGMLPLDLEVLNPDFYVGSGYKWLFGPKGTGILYINEEVIKDCSPLFAGAFTDRQFELKKLKLEYLQEASRVEYGTRNTSLMLGLASAIDFVSSIGIEHIAVRGFELADRFRNGLELLPNVTVLTPKNQDLASPMLTFRIKGYDYEQMVNKLRADKSIRLRAIYENDLKAIRASFAIFNSESEVDYLLSSIKELLKK